MSQNESFLAACREFGAKRLEIPAKAKSQADWQTMWMDPANPYIFEWGDCWTGCIQYTVADFSAEVGFWLDYVGLDSNALGDEFCMVMSPDKKFFFSFEPAKDGNPTPSNAIHIQFMLSNIQKAGDDLAARGIAFEKLVQPESEGSPMLVGTFRSPAGIAIDLWGMQARA